MSHVRFEQIAPVFPVTDLDRAISHYRTLGFEISRYQGDEEYAFARWDTVRLHLWQVPAIDPEHNFSSAFMEVDNADLLAERWQQVSETAVTHCPTSLPIDTDYGLREGAHVDPDGNLLRFAHKLRSA